MPSSMSHKISPVLEIILASSPRSVLDVGPGFGKYGVLCREYLDLDSRDPQGAYPPPRKIRLDCIEACDRYISPIHRYVYDTVYLGDALDVLPTLPEPTYDLALALDVLEHFSPEDGRRFVQLLLRVARMVLVVTPSRWAQQGAVFVNPFETHRSFWTRGMLAQLAPGHRFFVWLATWTRAHICLLSREETLVADVARRVRANKWRAFVSAGLEWLRLREPLRRALRRDRARTGRQAGSQPMGRQDRG